MDWNTVAFQMISYRKISSEAIKKRDRLLVDCVSHQVHHVNYFLFVLLVKILLKCDIERHKKSEKLL